MLMSGLYNYRVNPLRGPHAHFSHLACIQYLILKERHLVLIRWLKEESCFLKYCCLYFFNITQIKECTGRFNHMIEDQQPVVRNTLI